MGTFRKLPDNRCVSAHPSCVPPNTRGQLLQGRPHHPLSPGDDGNPFGTAFASSVRPSHGTAGRASIDTLVAQRIPGERRFHNTASDDVYEGREYLRRTRERNEPYATARAYYAYYRRRGTTSERASSARRALPPLWLRSRDWEWRERSTVGLSRDPPPPLPAVTPAWLSRRPACSVSPAAPTPPRRGRRHPRVSPRLAHRPTRFPPPLLVAPPLRRGDATLAAPTRSLYVCIPLLRSRNRANHGRVRIGGCLRYYYRDIRATGLIQGSQPKAPTPNSSIIFRDAISKW